MSDISGFKFYESKPAKTFGSISVKDDERLDICEWCTLPAETCWCSDSDEESEDNE